MHDGAVMRRRKLEINSSRRLQDIHRDGGRVDVG